MDLSSNNLRLCLLVRPNCELKVLADIPEKYLFLEYLAPLLVVGDLTFLHNHYAKGPKYLKFMSLGVISRSAIAIQAEVIVGVTC